MSEFSLILLRLLLSIFTASSLLVLSAVHETALKDCSLLSLSCIIIVVYCHCRVLLLCSFVLLLVAMSLGKCSVFVQGLTKESTVNDVRQNFEKIERQVG